MGQDTRTSILNNAEYLFSKNGFHGTSIRAICSRARVNIASINYHFGSKERLMEEVLKRRLIPVNEKRKKLLEAAITKAEKKGSSPALRDIVYAFVEPALRMGGMEGKGRTFAILIGRAISDPEEKVRKIFFELVEPIFRLFFDAFCKALPGLSTEEAYIKFHFMIGVLSHTLNFMNKWPFLSEEFTPPEIDRLLEKMVEFLVSGIGEKG